MASENMIEKVLQGYISNFNVKSSFNDLFPTWITILDQYQDRILWLAYVDMLSKAWKYPPNIGNLKSYCDNKMKELKIKKDKSLSFCDDCKALNGIRITYAGYRRIDQNNNWVQSTRVTSCNCEDSRAYHATLLTFDQRQKKLEEDNRISLEIYLVTNKDRDCYHLSEYDPIRHAKYKGDCDSSPNKYQKILELIMSGNAGYLIPDKEPIPFEDIEEDIEEYEGDIDNYDPYKDSEYYNPR